MTSKLSRNIYLHKLSQLEETVVESDCRDEMPVTGVKELRRNNNDLIGLQLMSLGENGTGDQLIQNVILQSKG